MGCFRMSEGVAVLIPSFFRSLDNRRTEIESIPSSKILELELMESASTDVIDAIAAAILLPTDPSSADLRPGGETMDESCP